MAGLHGLSPVHEVSDQVVVAAVGTEATASSTEAPTREAASPIVLSRISRRPNVVMEAHQCQQAPTAAPAPLPAGQTRPIYS